MKQTIHTKTGWLTQHGLSCGYMETNEGWKEKRIASLWKESGIYHVTAYDEERNRVHWECYDKYTDAKRDFITQLKARNTKRFINKGQ